MAKKLYVGGLSYNTSEQALQEAFSQAGTVVSAAVITDRETGHSRGFAFVEMATDEEAQAAVEMFNGKELDGRTLTVNEAKPREDRPARPGGGFRRGGGSRGGFGGGFNRGRSDW